MLWDIFLPAENLKVVKFDSFEKINYSLVWILNYSDKFPFYELDEFY